MHACLHASNESDILNISTLETAMTDTAEEPRRSDFITNMIDAYADAPDIEQLKRALEAGDIDRAIKLALGDS